MTASRQNPLWSIASPSTGEPSPPVYVIAEAGVNHNGSVDLAHQLVDAAAAAGADAVKFQTFDPALLVSAAADTAAYQQERTGATDQRAMLDALVLPEQAWIELRDHAHESGLDFLSTGFDPGSIDALVELGVPALKVPSGELNNLEYIRHAASHGLPLIISTGLGVLAEVGAAIDAASAAPEVAILHCVTAYPTPVAEANLRAMGTIRDTFGVAVGWSDHTKGNITAIAATALGATILEKHLTLDTDMPGPDHAASADPQAFTSYVQSVRDTTAALGTGTKEPTAAEQHNRSAARRSLHTTSDLPEGHLLTAGDVTALRPGGGIEPSTNVVGARLLRAVPAGTRLDHADVELSVSV